VSVTLNDDDLRKLSFENETFDVVYSQGVLEHFSSVHESLREQLRITKVGGYIVVDVPQTFNPYTIYQKLMMRLKRWPGGLGMSVFSGRSETFRTTIRPSAYPFVRMGRTLKANATHTWTARPLAVARHVRRGSVPEGAHW